MSPLREIQSSEFESVVMASNMPVMVVFQAGWCPPCDRMDPILAQLSHELADRTAFVAIDAEEDPKLASRLAITSVPTMIVFREGKEWGRQVGAGSREQLEALLQRALG